MSFIAPPEIWELVFRLATFEPESALGTNYYHYYRHDPGTRRVRRAFETKLCIGQVSRSWRDLVEPLLNEHVIVKSFAALDALILAMKEILPNGRARGEYVRRLDIIADGKCITEEAEIQEIFTKIYQLLSLFPHLKTLLYRNSVRIRAKGVKKGVFYLHSASAALESIWCLDDDDDWGLIRIPSTDWAAFLDDHPNLKSFQAPRLCFPSAQLHEPKLAISNPVAQATQVLLRVYIAHSDPFYLPSGDSDRDFYPNLRQVVLQLPYMGPMEMEMLQHVVPTPTLLEVHGYKLTCIHCVYHKSLSTDSPQLQYLPIIARHCPNLEELGLNFNWKPPQPMNRWYLISSGVEWTGDEFPSFPKVSTLKIQRLNRHFHAQAYSAMLAFVRRLGEEKSSILPNWKTLAFPSERDVMYLQRNCVMLSVGLEGLNHLKDSLRIDVVDGEGKGFGFGGK